MTVMPDFPARGAMEWHNDLKTYVDAVLTRSILPADTDVDSLVTKDHSGVWGLSSTGNYGGLPVDVTSAATLRVDYGSQYGVTQRLTVGSVGGTVEYVREFLGGAGWSPWQSGVGSDGTVTRIVSSQNYEHPLDEGELLIVTPGEQHFTDFSGDTVGQPPAGWTNRWAEPAVAPSVVADPSVAGGKVLRIEGQTDRFGFSWDVLDGATDVELLVKWRAGGAVSVLRPTVRGSGDAGDESGAFAYRLTSGDLILARIEDGTVTTGDRAETGFETGRWYCTRYRVFGPDRVAIRMWPAGWPEPDVWTVESSTVGPIGPGWAGVHLQNLSALDIEWVSAALDGGQAPMGRG